MLEDAKTTIQVSRSSRQIYLVDDDPLQARLLASQIGFFGYTVTVFTSIGELREALRQALPAAILMDIVFPEGNLAGVDAIADLRQSTPALPPVFFISGSHDLPARIQAVRAGGDAYFTKPVNIGAVIDALDRTTLGEDPEPYRVLIIDDSMLQARTNAMALRKAGMQVAIVTDPMLMAGPLDESNPELILLDMYMSSCNGLELAKVIRQMDTFLSVPIVFLSSETDRDKQMEAVGLGGDDFLEKPIPGDQLIAAATARIERYRQLRRRMHCDSLTGLLNHGMLKDRLEKEVARARRQPGSQLSLAMIDLDHFKSVNDRYGHPVGDRVLKSLSHLLSRRLRSTDILGRYGGEEFSAILPGTDADNAARLMNELRESFAQVRHQTGEHEFYLTFSCGVATYPRYDGAEPLCNAADQALYRAKKQGRNQVCQT